MSFSSEVKKELVLINLKSQKQTISELVALFAFSDVNFTKKSIFSFENKDVIRRIGILLNDFKDKKNFEYLIEETETKSKTNYVVRFKDTHFFEKILNLNTNLQLNEFTYPDFFRGAFLVCGSILNPNNEYHLEINTISKDLCNLLVKKFKECPVLGYCPSTVKRRKNYVIYLKESEKITDFLTFIGAQQSAIKFIQIKMLKEIRNNINRSTNFETANLSKITISSNKHIKAIQKIKDTIGLDSLPEYLKETAILRLNNPYISLKELANLYKNPISKSGINHRLKKIVSISCDL